MLLCDELQNEIKYKSLWNNWNSKFKLLYLNMYAAYEDYTVCKVLMQRIT